jgi:hypothetical protein
MYNQTTLHPIGLVAVIVLGVATLVVPRRYALAPFLIMACFISPAQRVVFATLDFNLLRLMVIFGWARVAITAEARGFRWKSIDTLLVAWALSGTAITMVREGTFAAFIYRLGVMYDAFGLYFLFRLLIRGWADVEAIVTAAAVISVPVAAVFLIEHATGRNMFAIFGGQSEFTVVRNGLLRCRGPFAHPILAGCFWAALLPLIGALWFNGRPTRWLAPVGVAASAAVIVTTCSATSLGALAVAVLGAALYPLRRYVAWMRWSAVLGLVGLHLVMINPVWHLLARIKLVGGTGWYRYKLFDEFVNRFGEWWLVGTNSYEQWWQYSFEAVTNHYVVEAVRGGLLTLVLFVALIAAAFAGVGRIARLAGHDRFQRFIAWGTGVSLTVHCAAFIAVAYVGQIFVVWYLVLGMVGSLVPLAAGRRAYRLAAVRDDPGETKPVARPGQPDAIGA